MASACVNNIAENFLDHCPPAVAKYSPYGWLSPRISFSREDEASKSSPTKSSANNQAALDNAGSKTAKTVLKPNLEVSTKDFVDFEFCLEDPAVDAMLHADELFSDGKLVPLHFSSSIRHNTVVTSSAPAVPSDSTSLETHECRRRSEISSADPYLFSPKAPRCSSRWRELLGLKKLYQNNKHELNQNHKTASSRDSNRSNAARSLKHFLHRSSKASLNTSIDSSLSLPLLKDSDNNNEQFLISSRHSLSSSSSGGHEHDDLPRLSLDSVRLNHTITRRTTASRAGVHVKHRTSLSSENAAAATRVGRSLARRGTVTDHHQSRVSMRGASVDSPRMNSSGKIVFHSLERSSSSPSTFNGGGGTRYSKYRGMERSYSANVRVTPVLNVPVCSLRGASKSGVFGLFSSSSSQQKKDNGGTGNRSHQSHQSHSKNRTDRNLRE